MGVFGDPVAVAGIASSMGRPHRHGTTPAQRVFGRNHAHLESRPGTTGFDLEPRASGITFPSTCLLHNERSYHALHNGQSAQRAVVPHVAQWASACRETGTTWLPEARFTTF